jgi:hypothetical protein
MDFPAGWGTSSKPYSSIQASATWTVAYHTLGAIGEGRVCYKMSRFAKVEMMQERRERFERDL